MSTLFASDLDRTLIHPLRTLPEARADEPVAEIYDGRPITVCSRATLKTLEELTQVATFAPVTTRSREQLERVKPIWAIARHGWAICTNGATLLNNGVPDPEWHTEVETVCGRAATVAEAQEALHVAFGPCDADGWLLRVRDCDARFLYAICDPARLPDGMTTAAADALRPLGWEPTLHGRKLYLLPAGLTKLRCVEHLAERLGSTRLLTAGDSLLDAELLAAADLAWCPADAELALWDAVPDGVRVTRAEHVGAAEEITREALADVGAYRIPEHH